MAAPTNYDQTNEWLAEVDRRVGELIGILKAGVNVSQSGTLGNLSLFNTLSGAPIGNLPVLQAALGMVGYLSPKTVEGSDANNMKAPGLYDWSFSGRPTNIPEQLSGSMFVFNRSTSSAEAISQLFVGFSGNMYVRRSFSTGLFASWSALYTTNNTTIDSNGFLKAASPIFRLANTAEPTLVDDLNFEASGSGAANPEAYGVTATRRDTGVYTVRGSLGFATEGWTVNLPQDANGNRLVFVKTEQAGDGTITVRTFEPTFDWRTGRHTGGDPIDIPDNRWIDLRLTMPEPELTDEPEPEKVEEPDVS